MVGARSGLRPRPDKEAGLSLTTASLKSSSNLSGSKEDTEPQMRGWGGPAAPISTQRDPGLKAI